MDVKKISIHRYCLTPIVSPNRLSAATPRQGALLRVEFEDMVETGYADLFPWPELGDEPLEAQLESLKDCPFRLGAASLAWAYYEARAKSRGQRLLSHQKVSSHKTLTQLSEIEEYFTHAKIKISSLESFQEALVFTKDKKQKFRLDFNGLITSKEMADAFRSEASFDFLEDPYNANLMQDASALSLFLNPIALDRDESPLKKSLCDVWVIKPVYYAPEYLTEEMGQFKKRIVITSNMDHPLGQLQALHVAQKFPNEVHGLLTQDLYASHAQSLWVRQEQSYLIPAFSGVGWGLDQELSKLSWQVLC